MAKPRFTIEHGDGYGVVDHYTLEDAIATLRQCVEYGHKSTLKYRPNKVKK